MPNENPSSNELSPCLSQCPAFRHHLTCLGRTVFPHNRVGGICPKNMCQQLCCFSVAPCQRSYARPIAQGLETFTNLGRTVFRDNRIDGICPEKPVPTNSSAICNFTRCSNEAMHVPSPSVWRPFGPFDKSLGRTVFRDDGLCPGKPVPTALLLFSLAPCHRSYACPMAARAAICLEKLVPTALHSHYIWLPPNGALPQAISHGFLPVHAACSLPT